MLEKPPCFVGYQVSICFRFCGYGPRIPSFLNLVNSVNALCILLKTFILFCMHCINAFVLSGQIPAPSSPEKRGSSALVFGSPSIYVMKRSPINSYKWRATYPQGHDRKLKMQTYFFNLKKQTYYKVSGKLAFTVFIDE